MLCLFLLVRELGAANVSTAELDIQNALHVAENLLVGGTGAALEVSNDGLCGVALGGEILLGHLGLHGLARLRDDVADTLADCVGLDDLVAAVDLGQSLAFSTTAGLFAFVSACVRLWASNNGMCAREGSIPSQPSLPSQI